MCKNNCPDECVECSPEKQYHCDLIVLWANGAKIEYKSKGCREWISTDRPCWDNDTQYRVRQEPKPDIVMYENTYKRSSYSTYELAKEVAGTQAQGCIRKVIDGETGKLKSVSIAEGELS